MLYLGSNVLYNIGYPYGRGGDLTKINPTIFFSFTYVCYILLTNNKRIFDNKNNFFYFKLLLLLLFLFFSNSIIGNGGGMIIINSFVLTTLLATFLKKEDGKNIYKIIMLFYKLTCVTAVLEIIIGKHFFDLDPVLMAVDRCYDPIRATCFQGHALSNCLIIDIIMLFIAFSSLELKKKMLYLFMGMLAILAFGSRSSLLLWCGLIFVILCFYLFQKKYNKTTKISAFALLFIMAISIFYFLTNSALGTRIMAHAEFDTSAEIRLRSLEAISHMNTNELLWGFPQDRVDFLYESINVNALENFYIIWIMKFGIINSAVLLIIMFIILFNSMKQYKSFNKFIIISAFILVASTNNSMGTGGIFLSIFYLCALGFQNKYQNYDPQNNSLLLVRK